MDTTAEKKKKKHYADETLFAVDTPNLVTDSPHDDWKMILP